MLRGKYIQIKYTLPIYNYLSIYPFIYLQFPDQVDAHLLDEGDVLLVGRGEVSGHDPSLDNTLNKDKSWLSRMYL